MALNRSTDQVDISRVRHHETVTVPIPILGYAVEDPNININISLKYCGLFAQTSIYNENATAFARLLSSAVDAEPESYQQANATSLAAIAILKRHPELLFQKGMVTDHFGRRIWASPYQLFLGAGDVWALSQVHELILPKITDGKAQADFQFQQQFPNCPWPPTTNLLEDSLYDVRNISQVAMFKAHLTTIVERVTADPCTNDITNGVATLPETTQEISVLRQIVASKNDEEIRTGLHFPHAILTEAYTIYEAHRDIWSGAQLAFYSREVIGTIEAALTAVDGQCCKTGLGNLNFTTGPDRRDGLFCRHPKSIPAESLPFSDKLGETIFVDIHDGSCCISDPEFASSIWYHKVDPTLATMPESVTMNDILPPPLIANHGRRNICETFWAKKAERYMQIYSAIPGPTIKP